MTTAALTAEHQEVALPPHVARFGMIVFLASEVMLFAGLIGGYIVLRLSNPGGWHPANSPELPVWPRSLMSPGVALNTLILISSSFTYHWAEVDIKKGKHGSLPLFVTALLGSVF